MERPYLLIIDPESFFPEFEEYEWYEQSWERALLDVCGLTGILDLDRGGHTDYTWLRDFFDKISILEWFDEATFEALCESASVHYHEMAASKLAKALSPQVISTLAKIEATSEVIVSACSGMNETMLRTILEQTGLSEHMAVGFSAGSDWQSSKPDVINSVRSKAGQAGIIWPETHTIYMTMYPEDVVAARSVGIKTIGIGPAALAADIALPRISLLPEVLTRWEI